MNKFSNFFITLIVLLFMSFQQANGQIWKKIKEKTQRKVENTISDKASDKAAEIAANNMDKMLNADINPFNKGSKKKDTSDLPDSYSFGWKYELQMQAHEKEKKKMVIDYYISPGNAYFGFSMPQMQSMFTIMDRKHDAMISYMEQNGKPIAIAYSLPESDDKEKDQQDESDYTVTKLPNKEFLGHDCRGAQLENSTSRIIMYIATDTEVSFSDAFTSDKSKVPANFKNYVSKNNTGLMMYMKFINKDDEKKNVVMKCVSLEEALLVKSNGNYTFL